ncbi:MULTISPECIES: hypothetical protein [Brevibacterium]|jgi:hypothetical protein|uniref:Cell division protein FtsL n=1 Tax=Brevibacterium salitolerans TaxID=1403566 RepID=A0ABN2X7J3_9MICO|nr:hypothetical protein [Brevibacterium sp.]
MSTAESWSTAPAHPAPERFVRRTARRLSLVLPQVSRPRIPVVVWGALIVLVGVVLILVGNIIVSHTTFKVESLTQQQEALQEERDRLVEDISYRESPQNVAETAEERGLVRDQSPAFLDERTGEITHTEPGPAADPEREVPERIPGPRADAREDVKPNLRSDERLPVVGGGEREFVAPGQEEPQR